MKKNVLFSGLLILVCLSSYSQIVFEPGYYIDESGARTNCLIRNIDWRNNPTEFEYKLDDGVTRKADIREVSEFGVTGGATYLRAAVEIDRSSSQLNSMSTHRSPVFGDETLFLKRLMQGKASLFEYVDGNLIRYFFQNDTSEVRQLIFKHYLVDTKMGTNNDFRQQLLLAFQPDGISISDVERVTYDRRSLERFFVKVNGKVGEDVVLHNVRAKGQLFNLSIRPGFKTSSLRVESGSTITGNTDFGSVAGPRFGVEAEIVMPFNKNKWGIIVEPTYQYYNAVKTRPANNVAGGVLVSTVDYQSVELPIGVRHYFFLNDKSKIFANISFILDLSQNSKVTYGRNDGSVFYDLEMQSRHNVGIGLGFKYGKRYSVEVRYHTPREVLSDYLFWTSSYKTLGVILGYSIL